GGGEDHVVGAVAGGEAVGLAEHGVDLGLYRRDGLGRGGQHPDDVVGVDVAGQAVDSSAQGHEDDVVLVVGGDGALALHHPDHLEGHVVDADLLAHRVDPVVDEVVDDVLAQHRHPGVIRLVGLAVEGTPGQLDVVDGGQPGRGGGEARRVVGRALPRDRDLR